MFKFNIFGRRVYIDYVPHWWKYPPRMWISYFKRANHILFSFYWFDLVIVAPKTDEHQKLNLLDDR